MCMTSWQVLASEMAVPTRTLLFTLSLPKEPDSSC